MNQFDGQKLKANDSNSQEIIKRLEEISKKLEIQNLRLNKLETNSYQKVSELQVREVAIKSNDKEINFDKQPFRNPVQAEASTINTKQDSVEERIAGNWFAKIGILAVVIGVAFFLKYAFDNDWINEYFRIAIGVVLGGALFGTGVWLIKKYFIYGQVLAGGGLGILYLSFFSAYNFYHIISYPAAFLLISLVTTVAIIISIYKNTPSLTYVASIMAFLTPFLLWSGENNQIGLLSYVLILDLAIVVISLIKKEQIWGLLGWLGLVATEIIFLVWQSAYSTTSQLPITILFLSIFFVLFSVLPVIKLFLHKEFIEEENVAYVLITGGVFFLHTWFLLASANIEVSLLPLMLALYYGVLSIVAYLINSSRKLFYSFLISLTTLFAVIFIPIYFHGQSITYFWILELVLMAFLASKFKNVSYMVMSAVIGMLVVIRLFTFDNLLSGALILNERFALFIAATIAFYLIAWFFSQGKKTTENKEEISYFQTMKITAIILANLFTVYAFNKEIESYFKLIENSDAGAIALSIWWLIYSIILIIIGFVGKFKKLRLGGLVLLFLAILKLFFYDLWSLGQLYRIISSIALGLVLLLVSFGYQKYKHLINDLI